ncbi:hypothetical protein SLS53_002035 [Cytospora paraplurivora]|uniref:Uncharacterized protein n=1 Tax=Cytospora paraplurivora TaxID=2898453 RepID=A0AAN9UHG5_9PEZI
MACYTGGRRDGKQRGHAEVYYDNSLITSLSGLLLDLSRGVFYSSKDFVKHGCRVMNDDFVRHYPSSHYDPWNFPSATRPGNLMLDARDMSEVLQEIQPTATQPSTHAAATLLMAGPCGILDFFQLFPA